jgi:CHAT domain-containing protein/tetratricopeptide (TPR) repeat protein
MRLAPSPSPSRSPTAILAALLLSGSLACDTPAPRTAIVERAPEPVELSLGVTIDGELVPGQTDTYRLRLVRGQFLRLRLDQLGVDAELELRAPDGELLAVADRQLAGSHGPESLLVVARRDGAHEVAVRVAAGRAGPYRIEVDTLRAATADDRLAATTYGEFLGWKGLDRAQRARLFERSAAVWRRLGESTLEAEVHATRGRDHFDHRELDEMAAAYGDALAALAVLPANDERAPWELLARSGRGTAFYYQARYDEAAPELARAIDVAEELGDRAAAADSAYALGSIHYSQGDLQSALSRYESALERMGDAPRASRPYVLNNLATLYRLYFDDPERARSLLLDALDSYIPDEVPTHAVYQARTLRQLGLLAEESGDLAEARERLEAALAVPAGLDVCGRANLLTTLAGLEERARHPRVARLRREAAREILDADVCPREEVTVELLVAEAAAVRGDAREALERYRVAARRAQAQGDRSRRAAGLAGVARSLAALGRPDEALASSRRVLALHEETRPEILRDDLRQGFFAAVQDHFDLHLDLLVRTGDEAGAWSTAERARARVFRDLLVESRHGLRARADRRLLERESSLQRALYGAEKARGRAAETAAPELAVREAEVADLVDELERVRGEIRRADPAWGALTAPEPLTVDDVQRRVVDGETLLLTVRRGAKASRLWAITDDSFVAVPLPAGPELDRLAREAVAWARSLRWPGRPPPALCRLSREILQPVAPLLARRRRVALVLDGALETVPFAALPAPAADGRIDCADAPFLLASHEVVHLPSVGALLAQRRLDADWLPAAGWLAVMADPVYGETDPRLAPRTGIRPASRTSPAPGRTGRLRRLAHTGVEARSILARVPTGRSLGALGVDASKATVTDGALAGYRVVHFATHGILDPQRPLLSHLALSERDGAGAAVEGSLYAHEIARLELDAELVVLSACDTALGREVRGEGLVAGLPRAFQAAGASRVLVSLWPVEDRGTGQLMDQVYRGLLDQNLPPAEALRRAQARLARRGEPPHRWAGFVLQGDWRPLPAFSDPFSDR